MLMGEDDNPKGWLVECVSIVNVVSMMLKCPSTLQWPGYSLVGWGPVSGNT